MTAHLIFGVQDPVVSTHLRTLPKFPGGGGAQGFVSRVAPLALDLTLTELCAEINRRIYFLTTAVATVVNARSGG